jgi:hypothetical protein
MRAVCAALLVGGVWLAVPLLATSCYNPEYIEGLYCAENQDSDCPPGQQCMPVGSEWRCYTAGATVDAARTIDTPPAPDMFQLCSLYPSGGCGAGQKCTIDTLQPTAPQFCTQTGTKIVGFTCSGTGSSDQCATGLMCLSGTCRAFCGAADSATCSGANACVAFSNPVFSVCVPTCNPLAQDCPASGNGPQNCYQGTTTGECLTSSTNRPVGSACEFGNECIGGSGCINKVCVKYCDYTMFPEQQGTCTPGQTCQELVSNVGGCL